MPADFENRVRSACINDIVISTLEHYSNLGFDEGVYGLKTYLLKKQFSVFLVDKYKSYDNEERDGFIDELDVVLRGFYPSQINKIYMGFAYNLANSFGEREIDNIVGLSNKIEFERVDDKLADDYLSLLYESCREIMGSENLIRFNDFIFDKLANGYLCNHLKEFEYAATSHLINILDYSRFEKYSPVVLESVDRDHAKILYDIKDKDKARIVGVVLIPKVRKDYHLLLFSDEDIFEVYVDDFAKRFVDGDLDVGDFVYNTPDEYSSNLNLLKDRISYLQEEKLFRNSPERSYACLNSGRGSYYDHKDVVLESVCQDQKLICDALIDDVLVRRISDDEIKKLINGINEDFDLKRLVSQVDEGIFLHLSEDIAKVYVDKGMKIDQGFRIFNRRKWDRLQIGYVIARNAYSQGGLSIAQGEEGGLSLDDKVGGLSG